MKPYIYIDFEMNKTHYGPSEIIAIGATKVISGAIVDQFYSLVALSKSDEIDVSIVLLTGINNHDIKTAPKFCDVWKRFLDWAGHDQLYCWGDYDKQSLHYTWRENFSSWSHSEWHNCILYIKKIIDVEKVYGLNKGEYKESLKTIVKTYCSDITINERQIHNPVYDSEILSRLHQVIIAN